MDMDTVLLNAEEKMESTINSLEYNLQMLELEELILIC